MSALVLQPAGGKAPGRMKQPTKDTLRHWLVLAVERNEKLQGENLVLRRAGLLTPEEREPVLAELIEAAASLGHHETLRTSSDETIEFWRAEVQRLRAALNGEHHG
ncbi:hypothetical protein [Lelliottia jeotgali]|jgi:predicted secreted protein